MKYLKQILIIITSLVSGFYNFSLCQSPSTLEAFELYFNQKHYEAIEKLTETIDDGPKSERHYCMYYRAYSYLVLGDQNKSLQDLNNALNVDTTNEYYSWTMASSHALIARISERQGNLLKSKHHLYLAMKYSPDSFGIYSDLSLIQIKTNQLDSAYLNIKKAVELDSTQGTSFSNLALIHLKKDEIEEAFNAVEKSIELTPENPYAYKHKALIYLKNNDIEKACINLNKAKMNGYSYYSQIGALDSNEVRDLINKYCKNKIDIND